MPFDKMSLVNSSANGRLQKYSTQHHEIKLTVG